MRIPLAQPEILDSDIEAVIRVLRTPNLAMGPALAEFESAIAAYIGAPFAVAVNSGTSALHLAVRCLDLHEADEVIVPSFAFAAVTNVLLQERITPVFVDVDPRTLNATPAAIEAAIGPRTRAVLVVHTFGYPAEIDAIREITRRHKVALIEDACEALGAEVQEKKIGTFSDAATFAFYPNKQITTGEGGILVTTDSRIARRAKLLRSQAKDDSLDWAGQHTEIGYSYRISDMNCALGTAQLARLDSLLEQRRRLAASYEARLHHHPAILPPQSTCSYGRISWFAYVVQLAGTFTRQDRDRVWQSLLDRGIGAARYFAPLHNQPVLQGRYRQSGSLAVTESVASRVLALPFFVGLTENQIDEVCSPLLGLLTPT
jgi:dTDP-4-amino-4,6-dideoxygalactose transaminase